MRSGLMALTGTLTLLTACGGANPYPEPAGSPGSAQRDDTGPTSASCAARNSTPRIAPVNRGDTSSAVALARFGERTIAYIADEDDAALQVMDVDSGRPLGTVHLQGSPSHVLVLDDGRIAVSLRDKNRVQLLEPAETPIELQALCSTATPIEPIGLAAHGDTLLVTSGFGQKLSGYSLSDLSHRYASDLDREPRTVLVDDDGKRAWVSHVVGGKLSVVDLGGDKHDAREIDIRVKRTADMNARRATRESCQGFALAKSVELDSDDTGLPRRRVFAPRVSINPGEPEQNTSGYGGARFSRIEIPVVSVVDSDAERPMTRAVLEHNNQNRTGECLLPRSAVMSGASGGLLVACLGSDTIVEVDPRGVDPARLERRRWKVPAGPVAVTVDDKHDRAVVWSQFDRQMSVIDLGRDARVASLSTHGTPPAARPSLNEKEAWGRRLFHKTDDPRISSDGRACASCHPDGREDALTWSTPVGPRQTIMLAGRLDKTGPFSWLGSHETLDVHLETTFVRLGGTGLQAKHARIDELDALKAYLRKMEAPNFDGARMGSEQAALAAHGRELFYAAEQGCADCHIGGRGTDTKQHDLKTRAQGDTQGDFDTPSLRFVGGTAPYFHDGRYASLEDLLLATDSQMGHTLHLARSDARALAAFLGTL